MTAKKRKPQQTDGPTLREVAAAANVSEMTVSRVLRKKGSFSDKTRDHVLKVVEDLGYVPNRLAGSLATSRSNLIAVIIPSLTSQVFTEILAGITAQLDAAGYKAVIGIPEYDVGKEEELIRSMLSWRPSGLIVSNMAHSDGAKNLMRHASLPIVEMMEVEDDPIDTCVGIRQAEAGSAMARYLIDRGYRRMAYLGWDNPGSTATKRLEGFERQLQAVGLALAAVFKTEFPPDIEMGKAGLKVLLEESPDLDAVFYSNDVAAAGGLIHCMEAGIDVPSSLALAAYSGLKIGRIMPRQLTTIQVNRFEIGELSARVILDRLDGKTPDRVHDVGFELIAGGTT
ncbi:MAG: LacI family DNA-binding transcriptional regulator [Rhodospirillales bacterium]|nr:LacI family DNA-binding transcriptional regulator [Rhodospirillales bacterium]